MLTLTNVTHDYVKFCNTLIDQRYTLLDFLSSSTLSLARPSTSRSLVELVSSYASHDVPGVGVGVGVGVGGAVAVAVTRRISGRREVISGLNGSRA